MPTIALQNATKYYKIKRRKKVVGVEDINLTILQGEFVFVIGSSGAGKSTLLNLLSGKAKPDRGSVSINGVNIIGLFGRRKQAQMVGVVSQEVALMRRRTIRENLEIAARATRLRVESKKKLQERVDKVLGLVGMPNCGDRYPVELSVGECRKVELARAMINSPPLLVLDELTANLDDDNIWDIFHLLNDINSKGTTVVMATHARQYVNIMRKRVITLVDGKVFGDVQKGRYGDVV